MAQTAEDQILTILLNSKRGDELPVATTIENEDLTFLWSYNNNRLEAIQRTITEGVSLLSKNNLSDVDDVSDSRDNLDIYSKSELYTKNQVDILISNLQGAMYPQGNWDANLNDPDITLTTETGFFWIVAVEGSTDLGGITDWRVNDWAVKTDLGWAKVDNTESNLEWSTYSGTRLGLDLVCVIGDYDSIGNETKLTVDDQSQVISLSSEEVSIVSLNDTIIDSENLLLQSSTINFGDLMYFSSAGFSLDVNLELNNTSLIWDSVNKTTLSINPLLSSDISIETPVSSGVLALISDISDENNLPSNVAFTNVNNNFSIGQNIIGDVTADSFYSDNIVIDPTGSDLNISGSNFTLRKEMSIDVVNVGHFVDVARNPLADAATAASYGSVCRVQSNSDFLDLDLYSFNSVARCLGSSDFVNFISSYIKTENEGTGHIDFMEGVFVISTIKGTGAGTTTYNRGLDVISKIDNPNASVDYLQGIHCSVDLSDGLVNNDIAIMLFDFDYTIGDVTGNFAYIQIQSDGLSTDPSFISGHARAINSDSLLPSVFKGDITSPNFWGNWNSLNDGDFVRATGDIAETITGFKTFDSTITLEYDSGIDGEAVIRAFDSGSSSYFYIFKHSLFGLFFPEVSTFESDIIVLENTTSKYYNISQINFDPEGVGSLGDIRFTEEFIYLFTGTNIFKRVSLSKNVIHTSTVLDDSSVLLGGVLSSDQNDYNPTGFISGGEIIVSTIIIDATSNFNFDGLQAPPDLVRNVVNIKNIGSGNIKFRSEKNGSLVGNRLSLGGDITSKSITLTYEPSISRWIS